MRKIRLHNPTKHDFENYPIDEHVISSDGTLIKEEAGGYKVTGKTLTWTIKAGETLDFPFYVADILMDRYEQKDKDASNRGLERVEVVKEVEEEKEAATPKDGGAVCKFCNKSFSSMRGLGLHISMKHPEEIL